MITGFNTDISYEGVTYHVQTEDKGLATPLILSLVYDRGTILASKRSAYDDLLIGVFDEKVLIERLQKQHTLMCAAVRAGRIEDLKRMTMKESAARQRNSVAQRESESKQETVDAASLMTAEMPPTLDDKSQPFQEPKIIGEQKTSEHVTEITASAPEVVETAEIAEAAETVEAATPTVQEEELSPAEAFGIAINPADNEAVADDKLKIELLNETIFRAGERKTITLLLRRGSREKGLSGAQVLVKIIGSAFRPLIFHAKTDSNGVATVHLQLPHFKTGRAAMLVKAISEGREIELRRVILQR